MALSLWRLLPLALWIADVLALAAKEKPIVSQNRDFRITFSFSFIFHLTIMQ